MDLLGYVGDPVGVGGDERGESNNVVHFCGVAKWCGFGVQRGNRRSVEHCLRVVVRGW